MRAFAASVVFGLLLFLGSAARAEAPPAKDADTAAKEEARAHFEQGLHYFDNAQWSSALAEFLRSRELFPTRVATKNAGTCLEKEDRFDEALDIFESFQREFPDAPDADKQFVKREIEELQRKVGTVEVRGAAPGTFIVIDGRNRGTVPLAGPLRVSPRTHLVKAYREGFGAYETSIEVASRTNVVVDVKLAALTAGGRLRVSESSGKVLDVVIDTIVVGKSPWEGAVAPGDHVVLLRGTGADTGTGTQPSSASVRVDQLATITLAAEPLAGEARIVPTPSGSLVSIDGVTVGHGLWEGHLRAGPHRIEVANEGFVPALRTVQLEPYRRAVIEVALDRDKSSGVWSATNPARIFFELDAAFALAPVFGGNIKGACTGACTSGLPFGYHPTLHGGYELPSGLAFGVDVGYARVTTSVTNRDAIVTPVGLADNKGKADDDLSLGGLTVGGSAAYHTRGSSWPLTARLGVGVFLGSAKDERRGSFVNSKGQSYDVVAGQNDSATYLSVTPEIRLGHRFGEHFEVNIGTEVMVLFALKKPSWPKGVQTTTAPAGSSDRGDGFGLFPTQTLAGGTLLLLTPGVGARYDF